MSLQVFLQAQIRGSENFLSSSHGDSHGLEELIGRCGWLSLLSEILPRALLAEMKLSRMLLGSSGGEQFLLVLTDESIGAANDFLAHAATAITELSGGALHLVWASTENLGPWPIVRRRLDDELSRRTVAGLSADNAVTFFAPFSATAGLADTDYFVEFGKRLTSAEKIGWSPDKPAHLDTGTGTHTWALKDQATLDEEAITFPRRFATDENGLPFFSTTELARVADGAPRWGILRGDVDNFDARLRRADTVEDHIHLSILFKEFFAGELALLCTLPEFWRKVSILYRGGDDFAVVGCWDALVVLARELQRVYEKFSVQNLQSFAGLEGKTISMALTIAPTDDASPAAVFEAAGQSLQDAKAAEIGTFYLFGRTLEWKRLADAEELKNGLVKLVKDFGYSADYIHDLASVYREAYSAQATRRAKAIRVDKPWRTHMRLSRVIPVSRSKERNAIRHSLITNLIGKKTANLKLRPSGRVGLEWARLATGHE